MEVRAYDRGDKDFVKACMKQLYAEDPSDSVRESHFDLTLDALYADSSRGRILVLSEGEQRAGYAVILPFWSNEYGGTQLLIDELFVLPSERGKGVGRNFLRWLKQSPPFEAKTLFLEVTSRNSKALKLYEEEGFSLHKNRFLSCPL